ncbi:MAG: hypothetical protein Q8N31_01520 [Reyranella sp.]|nr:hypothetical protein [Reyranella sp.]
MDNQDERYAEYFRRLHEEGRPHALLTMIYGSLKYGYAMPAWAAEAYCAAYDKIRNAEVASLDEAFGRPHPKGRQLAAVRRKQVRQAAMYNRVNELHALENAPLDDALFERVGREFNVGKTICSDDYYEMKRVDEKRAEFGVPLWKD